MQPVSTDTNTSRECPRCATPFLPSQPSQRYCSARCRKRSWDREHGVYSGAQRRKAAGAPRRKVIGLDGEGLSGDPCYVMLLGSDGSGIIDSDGLTTERCLRYLVGLPRDALLWSFAFSYDVNMILGSWPPSVLARLWRNISTVGGSCSVTYGRWHVRWVPGKVFSVVDNDTGRRATVWDVWPFVQSSFVEWVQSDAATSATDLDFVADLKERRGSFTRADLEILQNYCRTEVRMLADGVDRLLDLFRAADIQPNSYYGAGSLASAVMRRHRVAEHIERPPRQWRGAVRAAYRGGRFENAFTGWQHTGYIIDINSAYPSAARLMPCLTHATWEHVDGPPATFHALCRIEWDTGGSSGTWGPFPVPMGDGSLAYPTTGAGWYWTPEIRAARRTFGASTIRIRESVELRPGCDHVPFGFIDGLYDERMRLRAAGDASEKVVKLAINAMYGKLAQTVGAAPFNCRTWAGLITSHCRAQLLDAMGSDPSNVTMIATDSVTVRNLPGDLDYGAGLGQWSVVPFTSMLAIQPGLYFYTDAAGDAVTRSRGFGKADITYSDALAVMPPGITPSPLEILLGTIPTTVRRFQGLGTTVARGTWDTWRTWDNHDTRIRLNPWPRRARFTCTPDGITTYAPDTLPTVTGSPESWRRNTLEHDAEIDGS